MIGWNNYVRKSFIKLYSISLHGILQISSFPCISYMCIKYVPSIYVQAKYYKHYAHSRIVVSPFNINQKHFDNTLQWTKIKKFTYISPRIFCKWASKLTNPVSSSKEIKVTRTADLLCFQIVSHLIHMVSHLTASVFFKKSLLNQSTYLSVVPALNRLLTDFLKTCTYTLFQETLSFTWPYVFTREALG